MDWSGQEMYPQRAQLRSKCPALEPPCASELTAPHKSPPDTKAKQSAAHHSSAPARSPAEEIYINYSGAA